MFDAMTQGAAVFEPEEVDVLAKASRIAGRRLARFVKEDTAAELARLVHNLGRSRLRHKRRLATTGDAEVLAEEAVDLFLYLRGRTPEPVDQSVLQPIPRAIPIFPAALRTPPDSVLRPK